jgi:hypothetical protein
MFLFGLGGGLVAPSDFQHVGLRGVLVIDDLNSSRNRYPLIRGLDAKGRPRITPKIPILQAAMPRIEKNAAFAQRVPDDALLRRAVSIDSRDHPKADALEKRSHRIRHDCHFGYAAPLCTISRTHAITASVNSVVEAFPPKSTVRVPRVTTSKTALCIASDARRAGASSGK